MLAVSQTTIGKITTVDVLIKMLRESVSDFQVTDASILMPIYTIKVKEKN